MNFKQPPLDIEGQGLRPIESVPLDVVRRRVSKEADKQRLFLGMHREGDLEGLWYLTRKKTHRIHAIRQSMGELAQRFDVLSDFEVMEGQR